MIKRILNGCKNQKPFFPALLPGISLTLLLLIPLTAEAANYHVYGQVTNVFNYTEEGLEDSPMSAGDIARPIPGAIVEVWDVATSTYLGKDQATLGGYFHVIYSAPSLTHTIYFRVLQEIDGREELVGEVHTQPNGNPIEVTNTDFHYSFEVSSDNLYKYSSSPSFTTSGQFMFVEVGNVDMDDIYDKEQDPTFTSKWGLTKDFDPITKIKADSAFGGKLELYGLFGDSSVDQSYYYKIRYESDEGDSGYISTDLNKKNYRLVGTDIVVVTIKLGPHDVATVNGPLTGVYKLDERLGDEPGYSTYWTEVGLRALWNTAGKNGHYTLYIESWDINGTQVYDSKNASNNNFDTMNLRLVNTPPDYEIHEIQYLNGAAILSGPSTECDTVYLNLVDGLPENDNIQFLYTAKHTDGFMGNYFLRATYGHDTAAGPDNGNIVKDSYTTPIDPPFFLGADNQTVVTPGTITYKSCAYRFQLHVHPRITNGYDPHIYEKEDNWMVCVKVIE